MEKIKLKTRKITCNFNEEELKFNIDENKLKSGLNELQSEAKEMFEKINRECTFKKFRTALQARFWAEVSVYMLFPLVFILAIAGFEGGYSAFGLAWFFLGFLIVYLMTVSVVFYFL